MGEECCDHDHGPEGHVHVRETAAKPPVLEAELVLEDDSPEIPSSEIPPVGAVIGELLDSTGIDKRGLALAVGAVAVVFYKQRRLEHFKPPTRAADGAVSVPLPFYMALLHDVRLEHTGIGASIVHG